MTCYTRHLKEVFDRVGIEFTKENRRQVDKHFKKRFGKTNCSETWKELETLLENSAKKDEVIRNLRAVFS